MLWKICAGALAATTVALTGCSTPATPPGNYGTISGVVTSSKGGPIANATITIENVITVQTKSDGSYSDNTVPADPNSKVPVTASAPGYASSTQNVIVTMGQTTTVNFTLTAQ